MRCTKEYIIMCIARFVDENRGSATFVTTERIRKHCCDGRNVVNVLSDLAREGILTVYRKNTSKTLYLVNEEMLFKFISQFFPIYSQKKEARFP